MNKLYVIAAITITASAVYITNSELLEHASHYLHWLTIIVSGHHIVDEFANAIHHKNADAVI